LTTGFETFHEIIYGKSERGANERRVFFVPTQTESKPSPVNIFALQKRKACIQGRNFFLQVVHFHLFVKKMGLKAAKNSG
jgi:hypothetical protein